MSDRARRHDEVLGANVVLTGWSPGHESAIAEALRKVGAGQVELDESTLPLIALVRLPRDRAEAARDLLSAAGGSVELEEVWVTREARREERPACPFCGSSRTQPYTFAGPGARHNMRCTSCGRTFRAAPRG